MAARGACSLRGAVKLPLFCSVFGGEEMLNQLKWEVHVKYNFEVLEFFRGFALFLYGFSREILYFFYSSHFIWWLLVCRFRFYIQREIMMILVVKSPKGKLYFFVLSDYFFIICSLLYFLPSVPVFPYFFPHFRSFLSFVDSFFHIFLRSVLLSTSLPSFISYLVPFPSFPYPFLFT